jgi:hypothetical protein
MSYGHPLFSDNELRAVLVARQQKMIDEINGMNADYLLNISTDAVCGYLEEKYRGDVPEL